jgi:cytochrome c oxidase subunit 2
VSLVAGAAPLVAAALSQGQGGNPFLPPQGTQIASEVDRLFNFVLGVSVAFFLIVLSLMVLFVVRYRRRRQPQAEPSPSHNTSLEITWTAIPVLLVLVIFAWGFKLYLDVNTVPEDAYEIQVTGQKWKWLFTYPNGHVDEDLHVAVNEPIRLVMTSEDVIHGFFIPAFRIKHDVVPGRYARLWFTATRPGEYQIFCTQYCGEGHSGMLAKVVVHPPGGFEKWLATEANVLATLPPAEAGERLYRTLGCAQCHSVNGAAGTGPTFEGVYNSMVPLSTGAAVHADENYIRESILDPQAKIVAGFQPVMPTFKGRVKDAEITDIIAYLRTLKKSH